MTFRETPPGAPLLIFAENVTALDRATGRKLWEYDPGSDAVRRFAFSAERVFLLDGGSVLHCMLTATGQLLGKVETGILNAESMMIDGERLYVVGTMQVFALDLDGRNLWQVPVAHNQRHTLSGMGIPGGASIQPDFSKG